MNTTHSTLSVSARVLYESLSDRADDNGVVSLPKTLMLAIERRRNGMDDKPLDDLLTEGWVEAHPDGGWTLLVESRTEEVTMA